MEDSPYLEKAQVILNSSKGMRLTLEERRERAIELAVQLMNEARRTQTHHEQVVQEQLARMMNDPKGKAFSTALADQCFRTKNNSRIVDQVRYLLSRFGVPRFVSFDKWLGLNAFNWFGGFVPALSAPALKRYIRSEVSEVVLPGEKNELHQFLKERTDKGIHINLNHLGEAILGEEEAERRLHSYLSDLKSSNVECVSIKISTIFSQINLLDWDHSLEIICERLRSLYRAAKKTLFQRPDGSKIQKLVYLDMEEYRDLELTVAAFKKVLEEPEFFDYTAGIALQSYLPDSYLIQQTLTSWAMQRTSSGGAPIRVRLVKGANLEMEKLEAALHGWPQAPYTNKSDVDANFKRMLGYGCQTEHAHSVSIGVGSHNLFDISYALLLRSEHRVEQEVSFEMLEGMAEHLRRVVQKISGEMLLYAPAVEEDEFQNAVAYLIRRLDENTGRENFLRHAFDMIPGTKAWRHQASQFSLSCHASSSVSFRPRRTQNRLLGNSKPDPDAPYDHEPETDWTLEHNRNWIKKQIEQAKERKIESIPVVIAGRTIFDTPKLKECYDPSNPSKLIFTHALASEEQALDAISSAATSQSKWSTHSPSERSKILSKAAQNFRDQHAKLIGVMVQEAGKTVPEADADVTEAIDFIEYYRRNLLEWHTIDSIEFKPLGTVLVTPPWNFPCAIPTGGITSSLAAGNAVILKPAPEAVLTAWTLVNLFWDAGVPKEVLQFIPCEEEPVGSLLVSDERVDAVILTGATQTARKFMTLRPGRPLFAETGGKNSMIVTNMADRDLAIHDVITSAFGHSGQKCSACSLLILEKEVYQSPKFRKQLIDAASSLPVGSAWDFRTKVNPLISKPGEALLRGLTTLDEGEEWLLVPQRDPNNPHLWSPGIKIGVKPGSFFYKTELFGPVLGIMKADNLDHAIKLANGTPYGLTAGIHSLDQREQKKWKSKIEVGNAYINRTITGSIVERQPFGGCKASNFGKGRKAGGPNYLLQLMQSHDKELPSEEVDLPESIQSFSDYLEEILEPAEWNRWKVSVGNYQLAWNQHFSKDRDVTKLRGQDNFFGYRPRAQMGLYLQDEDTQSDWLRVVVASSICKTPLLVVGSEKQISILTDSHWVKTQPLIRCQAIDSQKSDSIDPFVQEKIQLIRVISPVSDSTATKLAEEAMTLLQDPVSGHGRIELLQYLREMSISYDYHRYGFLGLREEERRKPLPPSQTNIKVR